MRTWKGRDCGARNWFRAFLGLLIFMSALQVLKHVHKWGTESEISLENVTFRLEKFGFRVHRKLESLSNLHFSEVWVQSWKLIKSKLEKAYFNQSNLLWCIDLNLMTQINSWHWPGLVCQLRTVYRIILSWSRFAICDRCHGMKVYLSSGVGCRKGALQLSFSDLISLCASYSRHTHHLICFINCFSASLLFCT